MNPLFNSENENGESKPKSELETVNEDSNEREPIATMKEGVKLYALPDEPTEANASTDSVKLSQRKKRKFAWADEMQGVDTRRILEEKCLRVDAPRPIASWGSV